MELYNYIKDDKHSILGHIRQNYEINIEGIELTYTSASLCMIQSGIGPERRLLVKYLIDTQYANVTKLANSNFNRNIKVRAATMIDI